MSTRKSATNNGFLIFTDQLDILENIPDENVGKAIKLLLKNFESMEHISEDALTNTAYELIATNIRRYRQESELATEHGKMGGNPTLKGTLNHTLIPTLKQQDKTRQYNTKQKNTIQEIKEIETKIDYLTNPIINQVFSIYQTHCNNLTGLGKYYKRDVELKKLVGLYLEQTESNLEYFTQVCDIANKLVKIGSCKLDLKMVMNNHSGIYNGKYSPQDNEEDDGYSSHDDSEWIKKLEQEEPETWKVLY